MGDDWDPFAVDDVPAADASGGKGAETAATCRIAKSDMAAVTDHVWKLVSEACPWRASPNPLPDLTWYYPTCSFEDWKHRDVKVEIGQGIAYIILNRPNANNTINDSLVAGLLDAVMLLHYRKDIRMAIFTGEGKMLCAGKEPSMDGIGAFKRGGPPAPVEAKWKELEAKAKAAGAFPDGKVDLPRLLQMKLWHTLSMLPQFSIALVNGSVMGEGLGIVACCDMSISVSSAYFSLSDVKIGSIPAAIAPYIVAKVGTGMAKIMFCTAENLTAARAKYIGLLGEVVESIEDGHKKIKELAEVLTACGPRSVEAAKQLVVGVAGQQITEEISFYTAAMLAMVTVSDEARDGMVCVQSRKPKPWEENPINPLH